MTKEQIDNIFTYHKPNATTRTLHIKHPDTDQELALAHLDQAGRYEIIRDQARGFAHLLNDLCPDSREKSLALTKLQEAVQMANASIAINEN